MTDPMAAPPKESTVRGRVSGLWAEYPEAVAVALYAIVAMGAAITAYFSIFAIFMPYDDEGTVVLGLNAFADGDVLYRDIWSVYGPFYYELFGGPLALVGGELTTDSGRLVVIFVWLATSLLLGLGAHRLTGRLALGLSATIAAFATLTVLVNEPMHPHGLCVLLLAGFVLLAALSPDARRIGWTGAGCGALLAALMLTKLNLGLFAVAAVALAAALTVSPPRWPWMRAVVVVALVALPLPVMARDFDQSWVRELLLIEALAMAAVILAAWPLGRRPGEGDGGLVRWLGTGLAAFALTFVAIVVVILLTGPTPADVYDGIVVRASEIPDLVSLALAFPPGAAVDWAVLALAAAALTSRLNRAEGGPSLWSGALRGAAGLTIWLVVGHVVPVALNPSSGSPVLLPMLLAWVAAVPPRGARETPRKRFLRALLPALAVVESLQVYPVAGSQMGIAAAIFVPVGALCLADALVELRAWSAQRGAPGLASYRAFEVVAATAVAAVLAVHAIVLPGSTGAYTYRGEPKLPFAGADLMHLPPSTVGVYAGLVDLLQRHRCTAFVGYPSVGSLYQWSGIEAPTLALPNAWMYGLDDSEQQRLVDELRASPRPCAIRDDALAAAYLKGLPPPDKPLVDYVLQDFRPVSRVGEIEFLLPKRSAGGS